MREPRLLLIKLFKLVSQLVGELEEHHLHGFGEPTGNGQSRVAAGTNDIAAPIWCFWVRVGFLWPCSSFAGFYVNPTIFDSKNGILPTQQNHLVFVRFFFVCFFFHLYLSPVVSGQPSALTTARGDGWPAGERWKKETNEGKIETTTNWFDGGRMTGFESKIKKKSKTRRRNDFGPKKAEARVPKTQICAGMSLAATRDCRS